MTNEKAFLFLDSVIQKTKTKKLHWSTLYKEPFMKNKFQDLDAAFSYVASFAKGYIVLGQDEFEDIIFYVSPENQPTYDLFRFIDKDNNEVSDLYESKLRRLYDIVYSSLPSIDSFIDDFLNS